MHCLTERYGMAQGLKWLFKKTNFAMTHCNSFPLHEPYNKISRQQDNMSPLEVGTLDNKQLRKLKAAIQLTHFEIIWITRGAVQLSVDQQTINIDKGVIVCLVPGQLRFISTWSKLEGYYISVSPDFLSLAEGRTEFSILKLRHFGIHQVVTFHPNVELAGEMQDVLQKMLKEYSNFLLLRSELLKSFLKVFLIYISRNITIAGEDILLGRDAEIATKFMDLLKQKFKSVKKVSEYADELCVTPNYLNQMVKRVSGFPASYHIQQQIILEAKRLASYTTLRMKEVADTLGFNDYAHFSKFFKTYCGVSFSKFKNSLAQ